MEYTRQQLCMAKQNGTLDELWSACLDKRISAAFPAHKERAMLRRMLTDPGAKSVYMAEAEAIRQALAAEFTNIIGEAYVPPDNPDEGTADRLSALEHQAADLVQALHMILEGVTE